MKHFILLAFLFSLPHLYAQKDSTSVKHSGMKMGVLPAISYDADLGFQYGGLVNLFWYGNGKNYPKYNHSLYVEASQYTSGTSLFRAYYDSPMLFKKLHSTIDITYINDLACDFYGFNGYNAVFNPDWIAPNNSNYRSRVYYTHHCEMFRAMSNFKGPINTNMPALKWIAGFTLFNMNIGSTKVKQLNKRISEENKLPEIDGLYDEYVKWGLLRPHEINGGLSTYFKAGLSYDTRNFEAAPEKGIWTELFLSVSPSILSTNETQYAQISFIHRQYLKLTSHKLTLAYRIGIQHKLGGHIPFYLLPHMLSSNLTSATSQGLGGSKTLRGINRNRIVGNGMALANIELRWKFFSTHLWGQDIYIANNTFIDAGRVTQEYKVNENLIPEDVRNSYYISNNEKTHYSAGTGLKIAFNENFIISADYGKALSKKDGNSGTYILLNYLF